MVTIAFCQYDWDNVDIFANPGPGMIWKLQSDVSDDFNYDEPGVPWVDTLGGKWINYYHSNWSGPKPTLWKRDHVYVDDGKFKIRSSRIQGDSVTVDGQRLALTYLGCATNVTQVQYPVYIEANVKIMNSVLASDVWLLSADDTQEIDICEAYGGSRWNNPWFSEKRIHLSHHVFIREPFQDWQPSDEGSFYTDGSTIWRDGYHRIGVYWKDPFNLEYYVDGKLVRTRNGIEEIDPLYFTNAVNPGDTDNDTRTGMSKPMDVIINTEDQDWRALSGLTPTDAELANEDDNTFNVDWIRVYKPIPGVVGSVTSVSINPSILNTSVGAIVQLQASVVPINALDVSVTWESNDPGIVSVDTEGVLVANAEGVAQIVVTTNDGAKTDTCKVIVSGVAPNIEFINESNYLNVNYEVGGELTVRCEVNAGTGNTIVDGGNGGVKFWLREVDQNWNVLNDYIISDSTAIGKEITISEGIITLEGVPATTDLPNDNFYFLYATFENSNGDFIDEGIYPINIVGTNSVFTTDFYPLEIFPNPAQSVLNIKNPNLKAGNTINIISASGKVVDVQTLSNSTSLIQMDIEHLPKGVYLVRFDSDKVFAASFIKQ